VDRLPNLDPNNIAACYLSPLVRRKKYPDGEIRSGVSSYRGDALRLLSFLTKKYDAVKEKGCACTEEIVIYEGEVGWPELPMTTEQLWPAAR
jgi:hypothetical protein